MLLKINMEKVSLVGGFILEMLSSPHSWATEAEERAAALKPSYKVERGAKSIRKQNR